ncbi:MAG: hypothetical protein U0183_23895 [Polyangiaceae bacterium]
MSPHRAAVSLGALALLALSAACSGTNGLPDGYTSLCSGGVLTLARGFRPAAPVDFVGLRVESTSPRAVSASDPIAAGGAQQVAAWSARFVDSQGTLCGTAKDKAKCEKAVAAVRELGTTCQGLEIVPQVAAREAAAIPQGTCETYYLLYTRGDEVGLVRSAREAVAFFGPIDSGEEAAYVARAGGETLVCAGAGGGAGYASVAGGFNVSTGQVDCEGAATGRIVQIAANGAPSVVEAGETAVCR